MGDLATLSLMLGIPLKTLLGFLILIAVTAVWEMIWKGIALWKCGRNNQLGWFIAILILNTVGILPIIYLLFFQAKTKKSAGKSKKKKR